MLPHPWIHLGARRLDGYLNIWRDGSVVWRTVLESTTIAVVTAVATIALSVLVSWFVVRRRRESGALASYLATVSFLPQGVPSIVIGLALIFVYVRFPIPIYGTLWIIALAMTTRYLAFSSRATTSALIQVHGELEEASQMAGAPWLRTLRTDNGAAVGAGHDQRFFLGCGACHARAFDGVDAIQSEHGGDFNDDLEHVAKRQDSGCRRTGRDANSTFGSIAFGRAALVLSEKKFLPVIGPRP